MKKEQWDKIEEALTFPGACAVLLVEGREVRLVVSAIKMKMVITVYVDGWIRGEWFNRNSESPERIFYRTKKKFLFSKKQREAIKKSIRKFGKKTTFEMVGISDPDIKSEHRVPDFDSIPQARRFYEKEFGSVELVELLGSRVEAQ